MKVEVSSVCCQMVRGVVRAYSTQAQVCAVSRTPAEIGLHARYHVSILVCIVAGVPRKQYSASDMPTCEFRNKCRRVSHHQVGQENQGELGVSILS